MKLDVWLDIHPVGALGFDESTGQFSFDYAPSWQLNAQAFALSPHLPLTSTTQTPEMHSAKVRRFFENLLPEGQALEDAARANRVSKGNLVGLLIALGRETAGALRLMLSGAQNREENQSRMLGYAELSERIRQRPHAPFAVWDGKVRLSIAGHQDKLAVLAQGARWSLVEGPDLASTHILKPEPVQPQLAGLTSNEFFCMKLAAAVGIPTSAVTLHFVPEPVLCIERFDRFWRGEAVRRRHVIDGCQLLDLPSSYKYERPYGDHRDVRDIRDGATLAKLFKAIETSAQPAKTKLQLLRWLLFQLLIGNSDAHAKNISFYMTPAGPLLAPAYDLTCTAMYRNANISQTFAMAVGDAFGREELSVYEWGQFCNATGVRPAQLKKEIARSVRLIREHCASVSELAIAAGAQRSVLESISEIALENCQTIVHA